MVLTMMYVGHHRMLYTVWHSVLLFSWTLPIVKLKKNIASETLCWVLGSGTGISPCQRTQQGRYSSGSRVNSGNIVLDPGPGIGISPFLRTQQCRYICLMREVESSPEPLAGPWVQGLELAPFLWTQHNMHFYLRMGADPAPETLYLHFEI
jgi:hypothetical protein